MKQPEIYEITSAEDVRTEVIIRLFSQYLRELGEELGFQQVDAELENPVKKYGPPAGVLLLAYIDGRPAGCVALQPLPEKETCEMKRLFVLPEFRGYKLGRILAEAIVQKAADMGYRVMKLDTLDRLQPAIALYQRMGFTETSPYYNNPLEGVVYMQKQLNR
jgi:GNAT superfamily N-acetyltransferase